MKIYQLFMLMGYVTCGVLGILFILYIGSHFRSFFSFLGKILISPLTFLRWILHRKERKRQKFCRELCAEYFFIIGNNPQTIQYFEELIAQGIKPKQLKQILETNLIHFKNLEQEKALQEIDARFRNQANIAQFREEKEELLAQTRINLEKLRNKEKLLAQVYDKLNRKYKSEFSLPQETADE